MIATTAIEAQASIPGQVVIDTSAWIEYFTNSDLGRQIKSILPPLERCIVPTIVQFELTKWALRELHPEEHGHLDASMDTCPVDRLDVSTARLAASVHATYKLATADALIYATAQKFGADVITCDAHFKDLPAVKFFPKGSKAGSSLPEPRTLVHWKRWLLPDPFKRGVLCA